MSFLYAVSYKKKLISFSVYSKEKDYGKKGFIKKKTQKRSTLL
jgi:hypothetical protein